jgi:hypothetical protein
VALLTAMTVSPYEQGTLFVWETDGHVVWKGFIIWYSDFNTTDSNSTVPALKSSEFWSLFDIGCDIGRQGGCIKSHEQAGDDSKTAYGNNMYCRLHAKMSGTHKVVLFNTRLYDDLFVHDIAYSRIAGPEGVPVQAGDVLEWKTETLIVDAGFIICMEGYNMSDVLPSPVMSSANWELWDEGCSIDLEDSGTFINSHPEASSGTNYINYVYCRFLAKTSGSVNVVLFDAGGGNDYLLVAGVECSDAAGPEGVSVEAGDMIVWRTNSGGTASGFVICLA